ncbi:MAG: HNH endonuclease [Sulfurimonas sp.]|nr:HNH endonuclease [Sulfurimonas sp.]PHQ90120.1 MAG: HNH endonuclease [Sulfurimonas sp.]
MPKKICNGCGCNELISMNEKYCNTHRIIDKQDMKIKNRNYDEKHRNKKHTKFYNSKEWRAIRTLVLSDAGGLCLYCLNNDYTAKANMVDHIVPIEIDWKKRLNRDNLQPLCYMCHNKKTGKDITLYGGRV